MLVVLFLSKSGWSVIYSLFVSVCSTKQIQDDEKSVERAHKELFKLDQQMGVSVAQFTEVCPLICVWGSCRVLLKGKLPPPHPTPPHPTHQMVMLQSQKIKASHVP